MIINAEISNQPISGLYREEIYDILSPWNSQDWTWVKFLNDDYDEWYGEFRGLPRSIAVSSKCDVVLILTSDYLYKLDCHNAKILEYEAQPQYKNLTAIPSGDFLLSDDYHIYIIKASLDDKQPIQSPLGMDNIEFGTWNKNVLKISCEKFLNWDNQIELTFDCVTMELAILKLQG
ncbi:MAG: hypothetical protein ACK5JH_02850 [Anaerocolumna sp.]